MLKIIIYCFFSVFQEAIILIDTTITPIREMASTTSRVTFLTRFCIQGRTVGCKNNKSVVSAMNAQLPNQTSLQTPLNIMTHLPLHCCNYWSQLWPVMLKCSVSKIVVSTTLMHRQTNCVDTHLLKTLITDTKATKNRLHVYYLKIL